MSVESNLIEDIYPLSPMQEGMLFHTLYDPESGAYFQQLACTLRGELDAAAFRRAWQHVIDRHPILRSAFVWEEIDAPVQVVHSGAEAPWTCADWRGMAEPEQRAEWAAFLRDDRAQGFDLALAPLMRLALFQIADSAHYFAWSHHHLLLDGWSMPLVFQEVFACYDAFRRGAGARLERARPYREYIAWLQRQDLGAAEMFWRAALDGFTTPTPLTFERPAATPEGERYAELRARLPETATAALQELARRHQLTLNTIAQGAWGLLLNRYSGEAEVLFGATVAGRPGDLPGVETMVGLFINTLPVRVRVDPGAGIAAWLKRIQALQAAQRQYEYTPLVQIQGWSAVPRDQPLFESILVFENYPIDSSTRLGLAGLTVEEVRFVEATNYPITLEVAPGQQLGMVLSYDRRRFDPQAMALALRRLQTLLVGMAEQAGRPLGALSLLDASERRQLLVEWSANPRPYPRGMGIHQLFEAQAARSPDAITLIFPATGARQAEDHQITYGALNRRANRIARYLRGLGVGPETRAGIFMERTPELLASLLGILKAGAAYAAIDPAYPDERIALMLQEAQVTVLLIGREIRDWRLEIVETKQSLISNLQSPTIISLDEKCSDIARQSDANLEIGPTADHPVYLIFTSGSTGTPKAVVALQRSLVNLAQAIGEQISVGPGDRLLHFLPFSFDASAVQLFPSLISGGTVLIHPDPAGLSDAGMTLICETYGITILDLPTVRWQQWIEDLAARGRELPGTVRLCATGGEKPALETLRRWAQLTGPQGLFINSYGPTEATVTTTVFKIAAAVVADMPFAAAPMGRPIGNAVAYVLDRSMQPVPTGMPGELYIGGAGLARGYFNQPALTAEKFVPNPFLTMTDSRDKVTRWQGDKVIEVAQEVTLSPLHPVTVSGLEVVGGRLYRTGDQVRYLPDGNLEFLGRIDQQVKLRGYRIELGEIEAVLLRHPAVQEAVAVVREDRPGDRRLVAYLTLNQEQRTKNKEQTALEPRTENQEPALEDRGWKIEDGISDGSGQLSSILHPPSSIPGELRAFLKQQLPEYMIPAAFVLLERLPLTVHGKIDFRALPLPDSARPDGAGILAAPRTPIEELLAAIWCDVLGVERIGMADNFFELGGHSLLATRVVSRVRDACQVEVPLRALFEAPTVAGFAALVEAARRAAQGLALPPLRPIPRTGDRDLPLSFAQQRLWFLDQLRPGWPIYNIPAAVRLSGRLAVAALARSLDAIVERHEALRTTFVAVAGQPRQRIHPPARVALPLVDLGGLPEHERAPAAQGIIAAEARRPFDLATGPLLRAGLLRLGAQEHGLLLTLHHIVADGWSIGVFIRELAALYAALVGEPEAPPLPPLPVQYADFAHWQRAWLEGADEPEAPLQTQLAYWREQLGGDLPVLDLPTDRPRPPVQTFHGAMHYFLVPRATTRALAALSLESGATLFMTLLAAFKTLLARYSDQADIIAGAPIAGRATREVEPLIGFFVNTLALRTDLSGNPSFNELLGRVRAVALDAYAHQDVPFEKLVEAVQPERDLSRSPLFQVLFALQNAPVPALRLAGLELEPLPVAAGVAKFDLSLFVEETAEGLTGGFEYNTGLFDEATIVRMAGHFQTLLEGIIADPDLPILDLPLLTEAERTQLLVEWNRAPIPQPLPPRRGEGEQISHTRRGEGEQTSHTRREDGEQTSPPLPAWERGPGGEGETAPPDACVHELFAAQAAATPGAIAAIDGAEQLSYAELNARANQLAHYLGRQGIGPDSLVGVCMPRSCALMVALLGILKAGAAYLPLAPSYPPARLAFMLQDSQARMLITQEIRDWRLEINNSEQSLISNLQSPTIISLDTDWPTIAQELTSNPEQTVLPDHLAYVIYTSGSTGTPKGVMIPHRGLSNYLAWASAAYAVAEGQGAPVHSSIAFDLTITGLFAPLLCGRPVELLPDEQGVETLGAALRERPDFSLVKLTPAHLELLATQLAPEQAAGGARAFVIGGEPLLAERVAFWRRHAPQTLLINEYGPTETVVGCCVYTVQPDTPTTGAIPIGRPVANTQLYVLDRRMQPQPIGVVGELYIGGVQLARGYLGRPDLTADRFIPNPFASTNPRDKVTRRQADKVIEVAHEVTLSPLHPFTVSGSRLYKTGDLARWRADGELEFLGRRDDQIKLRGFRIELGEIEAALRRHPSVREASVIVREDAPGVRRLVAYFVPTTDDSLDKVTRRQGDKVTENEDAITVSPLHRVTVSGPEVVGELRAFLGERLPEYMIPAAFVLLDELPLTTNGKVDRQALPTPERARTGRVRPLMAPRDPHELQLVYIWEDILGVHPIGVTDNFFEIGGHSLLAVQLIARIKLAFGRELPLSALFQHATVEQFAPLLRAEGAYRLLSPAIGLQTGGARPPLFCVHPAGGSVLCYYHLARRLGADQPFYGLQSPGLEGEQAPLGSIEQMAAHYITAIRAIQPRGPYFLTGWSLGGTIAFEIARQLECQGEPIGMLALLDSASPGSEMRSGELDDTQVLADFAWILNMPLTVEEIRDRAPEEQLAFFLERARESGLLPPGIDMIQLRRIQAVYRANVLADQRYMPDAYPGRIIFFRSEEHGAGRGPDLGWSRFSTMPVEVYPITGTHQTILDDPHVATVIERLRLCLDTAFLASNYTNETN